MSRTLQSEPRRDGYRMPGEFERHSGCWMLWPERPDNWRLGAKPAQEAFAAVATAISGSEPVSVGVSAAQYAHARRRLPAAIRVVEISSNDAWMRDVGPTFVVNPQARCAASTGVSTRGADSTAASIFRGIRTKPWRRKSSRSSGAIAIARR